MPVADSNSASATQSAADPRPGSHRESFIPYRRADLLEMCLSDGTLPQKEHGAFRKFCQVLFASYHYQYLKVREELKACFAPLNPDADTRALPATDSMEIQSYPSRNSQRRLFEVFERVLQAANYRRLSEAELERAFEEESLIDLRTQVDFNDFEEFLCYTRGRSVKEVIQKKLFFWKKPLQVGIYERLVLMLKFKDQAYFDAKHSGRRRKPELNFTPGKLYLYYYKNVPRHDLEVLFPNLETSMSVKDLLLFAVPALGAAVWLVIKALPQILIIAVAIVFFTMGPEILELLDLEEYRIQGIVPVLIALLTVVATLGGFAMRQYSNYRRKQIQFQKNITDTLFFRNLAANEAVLHTVVDQAEEEVTKEILLAYYHLSASKTKLNPAELDERIERWMQERYNVRFDFDVADPLTRLANFGPVTELSDAENMSGSSGKRAVKPKSTALIRRDRKGQLQTLSLKQATRALDRLWDALF